MGVEICFSRAKSPLAIGSVAIRLAEKRPYSHVFIKFIEPKSQKLMVLHAAHGMVHLVPYKKFVETAIEVKSYSLEFNEQEFDQLWEFMMSNLGRPYSERQLLVIAILKILKTKRFVRVDGAKSYICSELAAMVCKLKNIALPAELDVITPSDLDYFMSSSGFQPRHT
jgi:hypothetical protein